LARWAGNQTTKDDQNVWSVTVSPLTPELRYCVHVDGATVVDPSNANLCATGRDIELPDRSGAVSDNFAIKDVPHGSVHGLV
jgi:hypothetical protein